MKAHGMQFDGSRRLPLGELTAVPGGSMHPKPTASLVKDAPLRPCFDVEPGSPGLIRATAVQSTFFESDATRFGANFTHPYKLDYWYTLTENL